MKNLSINIEQLGLNNWFSDRIDPIKLIDHQIARVTTVHKDSYAINNGKGDVSAEVTGKLMFSADSPLNYHSHWRFGFCPVF